MKEKPKVCYLLDDKNFTALRNFHLDELIEFIDKVIGKEYITFSEGNHLHPHDKKSQDIIAVLHSGKDNRVILFQTSKNCKLSDSNFIENNLLIEFIKYRSKKG